MIVLATYFTMFKLKRLIQMQPQLEDHYYILNCQKCIEIIMLAFYCLNFFFANILF